MSERSERSSAVSSADESRLKTDPAPTERETSHSESRYRAAMRRIRSLEGQLHATEQRLAEALSKVDALKPKLAEGSHYKSIIHHLRKRWYLRPFIPASMLEPPAKPSSLDRATAPMAPTAFVRWHFRGPRYDPPGSDDRGRVLIAAHELGDKLFGAENSLIDLIAAIDSERFDVFVTFPRRNDRVFAMIEEQVQGICVFPYSWWRKDRPFEEQAVARFEEIFRAQAIDLIHANTIMLNDPLIAAQRAGIPAIAHVRELIFSDDDLATQLRASPEEIVAQVCQNATYVLANSAATLANYPCGEHGGFLYNSIDPCAFDFENRVDPAAINVGLVSSNLPKKGIADFVEVARRAEERFPMLRFHLIGPINEPIERLQTQSPPRNLKFHQYVSQPPMAYRDLNIVLNLSHFAESFGRTVAEAMMARRPVIAYRYGALPELLSDGVTGFLVPLREIDAILDRLGFFVDGPDKILLFGERARENAVERFSPELFSSKLHALYTRLISEARRPGSASSLARKNALGSS
jgi:glycosyltransferase involved in cell wall biosynthesis